MIWRAARKCQARLLAPNILLLLSLGAPLSSCSLAILDPLGPVGRGNAQILIDATIIMLAIVIPTIALAFWTAWRYRASNKKADYLPYWSYSGRIEAVVWSIPILTIMFLSGLIWIGSHELDPFRPLPSKAPTLEVQVVSLDWKWLFIYPEEKVASVNQLVIPAGRPVHFSITSASVFNVFFVPRLGSMIYAMPGMTSQLYLQADRPTQIWGTSAQFSGDGFSDMQFNVHSLTEDEFAKWIDHAKLAGPVLDQSSYSDLLHQSQRMTPTVYGKADPHLFHLIANQTVASGAGPQPEAPDHAGRETSTGGKH
ncbi:cytochrome o ubiquinol oxidase subunit 2 [Rhizobium sp. OAE497]|jgi:cytochrome o ubiquinol oxidase subunit 2